MNVSVAITKSSVVTKEGGTTGRIITKLTVVTEDGDTTRAIAIARAVGVGPTTLTVVTGATAGDSDAIDRSDTMTWATCCVGCNCGSVTDAWTSVPADGTIVAGIDARRVTLYL